MKALTLWQPWASLVALGAKPYETRSWATSYRGIVAIHASKRWTDEQARFAAVTPIVSQALARVGDALTAGPGKAPFPLGAVVAVAMLDAVERTERVRGFLSPEKRATGDFSDGRFAWRLSNVLRLPEPVPCRGAQGLWTLPPEILSRVEAQVRT